MHNLECLRDQVSLVPGLSIILIACSSALSFSILACFVFFALCLHCPRLKDPNLHAREMEKMTRVMRERISNIEQARLGQLQTSSSPRLSSMVMRPMLRWTWCTSLDGLLGTFPGSEKGDGGDINQARYHEGYYRHSDALRSGLHLWRGEVFPPCLLTDNCCCRPLPGPALLMGGGLTEPVPPLRYQFAHP